MEIQALAEQLNWPSSQKLKLALKAEGIRFKKKEVDELVKSQAGRQVQAPTTGYNGRIVAQEMDSNWSCDLIDVSAAPSFGKGERYILCCQDVFSRYIWTRAIEDKTLATVAMASIVFWRMLESNLVWSNLIEDQNGGVHSRNYARCRIFI